MKVSDPPRPPLWRELGVVAFLLVAYDQIANLAALRVRGAESRAAAVLRLETDLHVAVERSLDQDIAPHHALGQVLAIYYDFAHVLVTMAVLALTYVLAPIAYRRLRTSLLLVNLVALGLFLALPVAPPRLLPGSGFVDIVAGSGTWGSWDATSSVAAQHANEYASMPSLHVAWATWVLLATVTLTQRRLWRWLAVGHLGMTVTVIVVTGNHWLLDGVAGAALALATHLILLGARDVHSVRRLLPSPNRQRKQRTDVLDGRLWRHRTGDAALAQDLRRERRQLRWRPRPADHAGAVERSGVGSAMSADGPEGQ
jgi:diacylglycerol O-acyltransferase